jgi:hypothetical protein
MDFTGYRNSAATSPTSIGIFDSTDARSRVSGHRERLLVSTSGEAVPAPLVERVRIGSLVAGGDDQDSHAALDEGRFSHLHQHSTHAAPLPTRRDGQSHDLPVILVVFVERAAASSDEAENLPVLPRNKCLIVAIVEDRLKPTTHLTGRCWITQLGHERGYRLRVINRGLSNRNALHWSSSITPEFRPTSSMPISVVPLMHAPCNAWRR